MEDAVRALVRPSETLVLAIEARDPNVPDGARALRVLALLSHADSTGVVEQSWCVDFRYLISLLRS
jgi:hypothetical protein